MTAKINKLAPNNQNSSSMIEQSKNICFSSIRAIKQNDQRQWINNALKYFTDLSCIDAADIVLLYNSLAKKKIDKLFKNCASVSDFDELVQKLNLGERRLPLTSFEVELSDEKLVTLLKKNIRNMREYILVTHEQPLYSIIAYKQLPENEHVEVSSKEVSSLETSCGGKLGKRQALNVSETLDSIEISFQKDKRDYDNSSDSILESNVKENL